MELNYHGAEQNLDILQGEIAQYEIEFVDEAGEPLDLSNVTFDGKVTKPDGTTVDMTITQSEANENVLHVEMPVLEEVNSYGYEIRATEESGDHMRIAYGKLGVLPTKLEMADETAEEIAYRKLRYRVPRLARGYAYMVWRSTTRAAMYAGVARDYALSAKNEADRAEGEAERAAREAEKAEAAANEAKEAKEGVEELVENAVEEVLSQADRLAQEATEAEREKLAELTEKTEQLHDDTEETRKSADATVQKLEGFLAKFADNVRSVVWVDPDTEHLIIGGVDTMAKVTGEDGKSPYVDENGDWQYWNDGSQQWMNGGPAKGEDGFSPYVDAEGFLVYRDPLTGEERRSADRMIGKDGRDGTAVRRHRIESVDELPTDEEHCNGGHIYYVPAKTLEARAIITVKEEGRSELDLINLVGKRVIMQKGTATLEAGATAAALAEAVEAAEIGVHALAEGTQVHLVGEGSSLHVDIKSSGQGWDVIEYPAVRRWGYEIYVWMETEQGNGEWRLAGEGWEIASKEAFGMVRLGTDMPLENGAVVGTNREGELHVPAADTVTQGSVQLSVHGVLSDGVGGIGVDEDGQIWVRRASRSVYGAVKTSWAGSLPTATCVGMNEEGQLVVAYASLNQPGVVRLGSYGGQTNPQPYNVAVGADEQQRLVNNLLYGGALQHNNPTNWITTNMPWLMDTYKEHPEYFNDLYYLGLLTSDQFTQSRSGLQLHSASESLLAGVYLASSSSDTRENAVPSATTMRSYVKVTCYTKGEVDEQIRDLGKVYWKITDGQSYADEKLKEAKAYTDELSRSSDSKYWTIEDGKAHVEETLKSYQTTEEAQRWVKNYLTSNYYTKSDINKKLAEEYYTKKEVDSKLEDKVTACAEIKAVGVAAEGTDMRELTLANPTTLYIKTQAKIKD